VRADSTAIPHSSTHARACFAFIAGQQTTHLTGPLLAGRNAADKIDILWRNTELLGCRATASDTM
jgi:hypothetical protein